MPLVSFREEIYEPSFPFTFVQWPLLFFLPHIPLQVNFPVYTQGNNAI